jgi:drug/metabolite transporter (DMT)-like permease
MTSVLGFVFANEIPDKATMVGGGIILIGVLIFNFGEHLFKLTNKKD